MAENLTEPLESISNEESTNKIVTIPNMVATLTELPKATSKEKVSKKVKVIFSNPWIGIVATMCTIVSFVFALYIYFTSVSVHNFTYTISPVKAVAVKSGQVSDLEVSYKGKAIITDITVVQIAIWNKGKLPIKTDNILKEIRIVTSPTTQILDASIRKESRDVIGIQIEKFHYNDGYIPISWKILEKNDGAVIQIIYAGSININLKIEGIIEGQKELTFEDLKDKSQTPIDMNKVSRIILIIAISSTILLFILKTITNIIIRKTDKNQRIFDKPSLRKTLENIFLIIISYLVFFTNRGGPPFGF